MLSKCCVDVACNNHTFPDKWFMNTHFPPFYMGSPYKWRDGPDDNKRRPGTTVWDLAFWET